MRGRPARREGSRPNINLWKTRMEVSDDSQTPLLRPLPTKGLLAVWKLPQKLPRRVRNTKKLPRRVKASS